MRYYATLGPACCEASVLSALLRRGVSGFRLNVSHTMLAARRDWIDALHDAERSTGLAAQLMIDLRGPEVRIGALSSPLTLTAGGQAESAPAHVRVFYPARLMALALLALLLAEWGMYHREKY